MRQPVWGNGAQNSTCYPRMGVGRSARLRLAGLIGGYGKGGVAGKLAGQRAGVHGYLDRVHSSGVVWHSTRVRTQTASRETAQPPADGLAVGGQQENLRRAFGGANSVLAATRTRRQIERLDIGDYPGANGNCLAWLGFSP